MIAFLTALKPLTLCADEICSRLKLARTRCLAGADCGLLTMGPPRIRRCDTVALASQEAGLL